MFKTSDKVVCVDDRFLNELDHPEIFHGKWITKGQVYVVEDIQICCEPPPEELCLRLVGIYGQDERLGEVMFEAWRFRQLEEVREENRKAQQEPVQT